MDGVIHHGRHLLRGEAARSGQIGAADVADEERVAGEQARRPSVLHHQPADALRRVSRRLQRPQLDGAEAEDIAVSDGRVWEGRVRPGPHDDLRACARRQLAMSADEIGMEVRFDDVADGQAIASRLVDVLIDVSLWIDHGSLAAVSDQIRSMRQAAKIELLEVHWCSLVYKIHREVTGMQPALWPNRRPRCDRSFRLRASCC